MIYKSLAIMCLLFLGACSSNETKPVQYTDISGARPGIECSDTGRVYYSNGVNAYCQQPRKDAPNKGHAISCPYFVGKPSERFDYWCDEGKGCLDTDTLEQCRKKVYPDK